MYKIISLDENNKRIKILNSVKGIEFSLINYIKEKINANIKELEDKYILFNDNIEYIFYTNDYLYIEVLKHYDKVAFTNFKHIEKEFEVYIKEFNFLIAKEKIKNINNAIKDNMWLDFMISNYDRDLSIVGSNDLSCYHTIEIIFKNAIFIKCLKYFNACPNEYDVFDIYDNLSIFNNIVDNKYSITVKIQTDNTKDLFFIVCDDIEFIDKEVRYDYNFTSLYSLDKENIIKKYDLKNENNSWYIEKENSHKALIFTDEFFNRNDTIGILFRIYKLCFFQVKYFRVFSFKFEPYKYDYKDGFIKVELWDCEFFKHIDSGYMIDLRFLQSINVYEDFIKFCKMLETFEK